MDALLTSRVGRSGGTPVSQMSGEALSRLSHQEMRANHAGYFKSACAAQTLRAHRCETQSSFVLRNRIVMRAGDTGAPFTLTEVTSAIGTTLKAGYWRLLAGHRRRPDQILRRDMPTSSLNSLPFARTALSTPTGATHTYGLPKSLSAVSGSAFGLSQAPVMPSPFNTPSSFNSPGVREPEAKSAQALSSRSPGM